MVDFDPVGLYNQLKTTASEVVSTVSDTVDKVGKGVEAATSSAGKAYLRQFVDKSEWGSEMFNDEEISELRTIVADRLGNGGKDLSYKHYGGKKGGGIGYDMDIDNVDFANPRDNLKFALGKANIIKDGDDIYVADTYDFSGKGSHMKDAPLLERVDYLLDAFNSGKTSSYGMAHLAAELFGAKEGKGIPIRIKVGNATELGFSPEDIDHLEDRKSYDARVADNTKPSDKKSEPVKKVSKDTVIDTSKAFKRFGVMGGEDTLLALRKASGDESISWSDSFVGSDGKAYKQGDRIPKGITLRVVR